MITILIITGLFIAFAVDIIKEEMYFNGFWDYIGAGLLIISMSFVGLLCGVSLAALIPYPTTTETRTYELESLQDNSITAGNFFLGSGHIEGTFKYVYYVQRENGSIELNLIDYNDVELFYRDGKPTVEETVIVSANDKDSNWYSICATCDDVKDKRTIYIPKGTIKQQYNLDAQ